MKHKFKPGDRVVQVNRKSPVGTVKKIRVETTRTSVKQDGSEPLGVTITVLWDNGTISHFIPEGVELWQQ